MDQDPSFPPLSVSPLTGHTASMKTTIVGSPDNDTPQFSEDCSNKQVKVTFAPPEPTMRRSRSDSDLHQAAHPSTTPSPYHLPHISTLRRRSEESPLPLLQLPKAGPSIAIDLFPGIPPTPKAMLHPPSDPFALSCPQCRTPRRATPEGQKTTVCQTCLTAFKTADRTGEAPQRRQSILTSFPPLLAEDSLEEEDVNGGDKAEGGLRNMSIVKGFTHVLGMLRGGVGRSGKSSRRGSESSLESWGGSHSGSSGSRPASRSSFTHSISS